MIESILGDLLTVFLDILIFNPSHPKTSKKRRLIRLILISLIFIVLDKVLLALFNHNYLIS